MKKLLPILLFLLSCCHVALSQDYPVQVTTIVTPPYSLYLSDYASSESNTLQVMLQLKELDRPEYRVKLRITIEGQGISLRTKATFVPRAIVLQGGVPEMLTGADLSAYLNPNNMDFLGTTQQAFMRTGMFPEGFYTFKVEVLDYVRNVVVSNAGVGNAFIILNDPPLINLPFNNDKVVATDPQNIIFSWTPRHTASPNAAFSTEYEFTLVELYPENRNPNDAIRAANSIYTTTTSATSLNYGIIEPLLIPGRKYAFRIRAYDVSGKDLFKNNGYSEVNVFQFGDACVAPLNVKADPLDPVRIKFSWEQQDVHTSYSLEFRKEGTSTWEQQNVINDAVIVPGLQGNTTYEYRVQGQCGSIQGPFSALATVITPASDTSAFVCGAPVPEIEINTTPLDRDLRLLDIIKTADFEVIITDLTANGDGSYKGTGRAMVPWFKLAGIRVKFSDIKVNQDLRVFSGNVTTIYSKDSRFVLSADLSRDDAEAPDTGSPTAPPAFNGMDTVLTVPITNVTIPSGNNTVIVVTTPSGQSFEIPRERNEDGTFRDTRITDANGDTWTVSSGGDIQRGPNVAPPPAYASRDSVNFRVNFAALENQFYGFDSKHFQEVAEDKININGEDYWIAWKSVETGRQDYVSATASGQTTFPPKVGFKTSNGPALHETGSSAAFRRVSVMGLVDQQVEALTAYVRVQEGQNTEEVQVGRLNVKAYDKVQKKVIVVPVNNASVPAASAISDELNKIYAQAVVGWEVIVEPSITVEESVIQNLDVGVSGMLSSFPENMMSFVRTFRNDIYRFIDGDAYYIFMVNNPNAGRAGFMPFNRKFGFVYTNKSTNVITTLAHELGHGAFNLRHTFSPEATLAAEGTTDNLMDYNNGTKLKKYQWDLVRNQETINGWFEGDGDVAYNNVMIMLPIGDDSFPNPFQVTIHKGITPNGMIITGVTGVPNNQVARPLISKTERYVITGYTLYADKEVVKRFLWSSTKLGYFAGEEPLNVLTSTDPGEVKVYLIVKETCTYKMQSISWNPETDSGNIEAKVGEKVVESQWIFNYLFNADITCFKSFVEEIVKKDKLEACMDPIEVERGKNQLLNFANATTINEDQLVVNINSVCKSSIQALDYDKLKILFKKLASSDQIKEDKEIAILRLASSIRSQDFASFYTLLESDGNALIKNLVSKLHDKSIYPWDGDNYTNFIGGLVTMFRENPDSYVSRFFETSNEALLGQVFNLHSKFFQSNLESSIFTYTPMNEYRYSGTYDESNGKIIVKFEQRVLPASSGPHGSGFSIPVWTPTDEFPAVSPMTPIIITAKDNLPLVQTALGEPQELGNFYVVPAIFLKFKGDKEFNDEAERTGMIVLDAVTIYASGGVALAAKVTWARRIWSVMEVAGAAGSLAINTELVSPDSRFGRTVTIFNTAMAAIGVKNLARGVYNFAKNLPAATKSMLSNNSRLQELLRANHADFKKALDELRASDEWTRLDDVTKEKLLNQEKFFDQLVDQARTAALALKLQNLFTRLNSLGLSALQNAIQSLDIGIQYRFADHVLESSDVMLTLFNKHLDLISDWNRFPTEAAQRAFARGFDLIEEHRLTLNPVPSFEGNTIAFSLMDDGKTVFGYNSAINSELQASELALRQSWFDKTTWARQYQSWTSAQVLLHGEAHSLMKAYRDFNGLPRKIFMFVDRETCPMCIGQLPYLMKSMGIQELKIVQWKNNSGLVLKTLTMSPK